MGGFFYRIPVKAYTLLTFFRLNRLPITRNSLFISGNSVSVPGNEWFIPGIIPLIPGNSSFIPADRRCIPGNKLSIPGNTLLIPRNKSFISGNKEPPALLQFLIHPLKAHIDYTFHDRNISSEDFTRLQELQTRWTETYTAVSNTRNRTQADVTAKTGARKEYQSEIRLFVKRFLTHQPLVSDADKDRLGLAIYSARRKTAPVPTTAPEATIDFSVHLRHNIHFKDTGAIRKGKPAGVHACEIWAKIGGEIPVDTSELTFLGSDTRTPYTATFQGSDQGKKVYYRLRWINSRSEPGPWSLPVSAVIG